MGKIAYVRVSTTEQGTDAQHDQLTAAGCEKLFVDHGVSGRLASRPQWDACLEYLRPGDVLVVTKLDRLGRSVKHLVDLSLQLSERGIDLIVLQQGIDTTTPGGRLLFHLLASIAEFEADLIRERTLDGLRAARARGRVGGRPRALTETQVIVARSMYDSQRHTVAEIATVLNVSRPTIYRALSGSA